MVVDLQSCDNGMQAQWSEYDARVSNKLAQLKGFCQPDVVSPVVFGLSLPPEPVQRVDSGTSRHTHVDSASSTTV